MPVFASGGADRTMRPMDDWRRRVEAIWSRADDYAPAELVASIDGLADERPGDPLADFERGGARDSTGDEAGAERHYRAALEGGLPEPERAQCTIQLASTLRNLGRAEEGLELLRRAIAAGMPAELADQAAAFEALLLHSAGRPSEALRAALLALAARSDRYARSIRAYAEEL